MERLVVSIFSASYLGVLDRGWLKSIGGFLWPLPGIAHIHCKTSCPAYVHFHTEGSVSSNLIPHSLLKFVPWWFSRWHFGNFILDFSQQLKRVLRNMKKCNLESNKKDRFYWEFGLPNLKSISMKSPLNNSLWIGSFWFRSSLLGFKSGGGQSRRNFWL
jgi:hypothetical protein